METLIKEVSGKTYRVKCHHGCQHAGDGVLFKFNRGTQENLIQVEEIGLDRHNSYKLDCTVRRGTSDNWALLKQEGEKRPYTFAIHRLPQNKFELYIAGQDAAVDYVLEEVDPRYENRDYYERRPSLKNARHGPSRDPEEEAEMEDGARQGEYCAHSSRSRSRSHSRSRSRDPSREDRRRRRSYSESESETDESEYNSDDSYESSEERRPAPRRKAAAAPVKSTGKATGTAAGRSVAGGKSAGGAGGAGAKKAPVTTAARKTSAKGAVTKSTSAKGARK
jgi:hypothetical protein